MPYPFEDDRALNTAYLTLLSTFEHNSMNTKPLLISSTTSQTWPIHKVLWTGGWDSTFRILDLVSRKTCVIQAYYIVDEGRRSHPIEIKRMEKISAAVVSKNWPGMIEPVRITPMPNIDIYPDIRSAWKKMRETTRLGAQYEWLAVFAREARLSELEMGVVPGGELEEFLRHRTVPIQHNNEQTFIFKDSDSPAQLLFENMNFPILALTKPRMGEIAQERGFLDILEMSWFCHKPLKNGKPCGLCTPCNDAVTREMAYRVGWRGRMLSKMPSFLRKTSRRLFGRL